MATKANLAVVKNDNSIIQLPQSSAIAKVRKGQDPFAEERSRQDELFWLLEERREIQQRAVAIEQQLMKAAQNLMESRGERGVIPKNDSYEKLLRFLPEVKRK